MRRYGLRLRYVALCDSQGAVVATEGLTYGDLQRALAAKSAGQSLAAVPEGYQHEGTDYIVDVAGTTGAIVIDVTASDETVDALLLALDRGMPPHCQQETVDPGLCHVPASGWQRPLPL